MFLASKLKKLCEVEFGQNWVWSRYAKMHIHKKSFQQLFPRLFDFSTPNSYLCYFIIKLSSLLRNEVHSDKNCENKWGQNSKFFRDKIVNSSNYCSDVRMKPSSFDASHVPLSYWNSIIPLQAKLNFLFSKK